MTEDPVKLEVEIPSKTAAALNKIAFHFSMDPNRLAVWLLEWHLAVETGHSFAFLIEDKIDAFLLENCWDHETIQHLQAEVNDILREKP